MYTIDNFLSKNNTSGNAMAQRKKQDAEVWKTMLAQINNTRPDTMLGYGLGKLLRGAWDHKQRRAAQKAAEERGNAQNQLASVDVRNLTVDDSKPAYYGIAPTQGFLGDGFAVGSTQTKHTVEDAAGNKETTTTNTPMIQGRPGLSLNEMAQQVMGTPEMMANGSLMDMLRKQNAYYGY